MKLRGWQIDSYGILDGASCEDLPDGLTVVYGPNEAGKSTLLAFLRGMLFGFHDGSESSRYPGSPGRRHGGRVEITGNLGPLTIERNVSDGEPALVARPDGRPASDEDLKAELGSVDEATYGAVFAFGLRDLQALENIPTSELQDRVLSAAIAGAGRTARQTAEALEAQAQASLPARGGPIRALVEELAAREAELAELGGAAAEYVELTRTRTEVTGVIESLGLAIERAREELNWNRLLVQCWPDYQAARQAEKELARLTAQVEFPADPEGSLATVNRNLAAAVARVRELNAAQAATEEAMSRFRVDPALAAVADEFDALDAGIPDYRVLLRRLEEAQDRIAAANAALAERLERCGPAWTEARIAADEDFDLPREEIADWDHRLDAAASATADCETELERTRTRLEEVEHARDEIRVQVKRLDPPEEPPTRDQLEELRGSLRRVRTALAEVRDSEVAATGREAIVEERRRSLSGGGPAELAAIVPRWVPTAANLAAVAAAAAAIGRLVVGDTIGTIAFGLLAAAAELISLGAKAILNRIAAQQSQGERAVEVRTLELEDALAARDEGRAKLEEQRTALLEMAPEVGIAGLPTAEALDEADTVADRLEAARDRWDDLLARLSEVHARIETLSATIVAQGEELAAARVAEEELRVAWGARQAVLEASRVLSPAEALEFLDGLADGRDRLRSRAADRAEIEQVRLAASGWENRARSALAASGAEAVLASEDLITGNPLITAVVDVRARCQEDRRARASLTELQAVLMQRRSEISAAEQVVRRAEKEREALFASIGVANEEAYRARLEIHHRQLALRSTMRELEMRLVARLGHGDDAETLRTELARGRTGAWSRAAESASQALGTAASERDDAIRHQREIEIRRAALESADDAARLRTEIATLRTELAEAVAGWRTAIVGAELVRRAMARLVEDRRPAVVRDAARMFAAMTLGRYPTIEQDEAGATLLVGEAGGRRKSVDELSRGTAEQLYLALRLGLVLDHAGRGNDLPVVMDDVLVNFDEERATAVAQLLASFSEGHQVILFTCHGWTVDMIRTAAPGARVVELAAGRKAIVEPGPKSKRPARAKEGDSGTPPRRRASTGAASARPS